MPNDVREIKREPWIVVVIDIASSTRILDELNESQSFDRWDELLRTMHVRITDMTKSFGGTVYKFIGDGWIILLPYGMTRNSLNMLLAGAASQYLGTFRGKIHGLLKPSMLGTGLTFGIDAGELAVSNFPFQGTLTEYFGRALNVACRLQSVVRQVSDSPFAGLMTHAAAGRLEYGSAKHDILECENVTVPLRGVTLFEKEFPCLKFELKSPIPAASAITSEGMSPSDR